MNWSKLQDVFGYDNLLDVLNTEGADEVVKTIKSGLKRKDVFNEYAEEAVQEIIIDTLSELRDNGNIFPDQYDYICEQIGFY